MRVITTGLCVASDQRLPCEPTGALPQTPPHPHLLELRIPAAFGHRFRLNPDRNPADVGQRSGVCRTGFRRHPDSNPGRSGQSSGPIRTTFRGIRTVLGTALSGAVARDRE